MNNCPYCQKALSETLKRKARCPFCGQTIFVRNSIMVSEYQSNKVDWLKRVEWLGIKESMIDSTKKELGQKFKEQCLGVENKSKLEKYSKIP